MSPALAITAPANALEEISFSAADFERVRALIHHRAGIHLHSGKQAMVYGRLSRRLRETGQRSVADYLRALEDNPDHNDEWQAFINCMTTNLTSFFREEHHFVEFAADLRARPGRAQRVWCNAASTGEEAVSIAITAAETLGADPPLTILATDIDTNVLDTARRGVYEAGARGLSPERLKRWFQRGTGANAGAIRVKPELARAISWQTFNLMARDWRLGEPFDFVFCRNVMIYFDAPTQRRVLERIHATMRVGGLLYVGHSENFTDARDLFRLRGKTIYERL